MYGNFISRHFSNQSGIIILVNWPRAPIAELIQLTEASSLGPDSPRRSPLNVTVKKVGVKWLWQILQSSGRHEHDVEHDETILE